MNWGLSIQGGIVALLEPKEIHKKFSESFSLLYHAEKPLSAEDQRKMAHDLESVNNYLFSITREKNALNLIHSMSAHDARLKEQFNADREQFDTHRAFIESSYEKVEQYFRTIQLAGYAAFFGLWNLSKDYLSEKYALYSLLLMIVSALVFMFWEVFKSSIIILEIKGHAKIGSNSVEEFIKSRVKIRGKGSAISIVTRYRVVPWFISILSATASIVILITLFVCRVIEI